MIDDKSFKSHDAEYQTYQYNYCVKQQAEFSLKKIQYDRDKPIGKILDENQTAKYGIDIGCGHGYFAGLMTETLDQVFAFDPSAAAVEMAMKLYNNKNITWTVGYAEEVLKGMKLDAPAIFHCGCVLSHLEDNAVIKICEEINKIALPGSYLAFSELYGNESHVPLWHCRTKLWWELNFKGWEFDFIDNPVQVPGRFKGFSAIRVK